jgi:hypothetical protein
VYPASQADFVPARIVGLAARFCMTGGGGARGCFDVGSVHSAYALLIPSDTAVRDTTTRARVVFKVNLKNLGTSIQETS